MKAIETASGVKLWLSANDTWQWAHQPDGYWPCSMLSGHRVFVEFDSKGDLVDMAIDGGRGKQDCDASEFNAIISDSLEGFHSN